MQTLNKSTCHIKTQTIDIHSVCPMCGYIFGQLYSKMYKNVLVELSVSLKTFTHTHKKKEVSLEPSQLAFIKNIRKEMQIFQSSIKNLSAGISQASSLWKDEKFSELSASIGEVANNSKNVMVAGDRCCSSVDKFNKIAAEKY